MSDNGKEFAEHVRIAEVFNANFYFAHTLILLGNAAPMKTGMGWCASIFQKRLISQTLHYLIPWLLSTGSITALENA